MAKLNVPETSQLISENDSDAMPKAKGKKIKSIKVITSAGFVLNFPSKKIAESFQEKYREQMQYQKRVEYAMKHADFSKFDEWVKTST